LTSEEHRGGAAGGVHGSRRAKDALFDGFARMGAALGSGRRAELIELLVQGERTVEHLAAELDQSLANTSHHLRTLARAGLVATRRDGTHVWYRLASPEVEDAWLAVRALAVQLVPEVDQLVADYLGDRAELATITRDELLAGLAEDRFLVIDVRPEAEHRAGHLPGAIPVPPDQLDERLIELPDDREIVAYCRGPYCVFADDAVRWLTANGRPARRYIDGIPEWRRAGGPVTTPAASD
jgi:rhodanese-related sulfurtransferase/DNA-binding transcriptional ArsR family regulator